MNTRQPETGAQSSIDAKHNDRSVSVRVCCHLLKAASAMELVTQEESETPGRQAPIGPCCVTLLQVHMLMHTHVHMHTQLHTIPHVSVHIHAHVYVH